MSTDFVDHVLNVAFQIIGFFGTREFNLNKYVINLPPPMVSISCNIGLAFVVIDRDKFI